MNIEGGACQSKNEIDKFIHLVLSISLGSPLGHIYLLGAVKIKDHILSHYYCITCYVLN